MDKSSIEEFQLLLAACFFGAIVVAAILFIVSLGAPALHRESVIESATSTAQ